MNLFRRLNALIYVTLALFTGVSILLAVTRVLPFDKIMEAMRMLYFNDQYRMIWGVFAAVLLFYNYLFYKFCSVRARKDKIIAFDNPSGRVSVSLFALEDLVKRTLSQIEEIKEARPLIKATRRGIQVRIRLCLSGEMNIPELTSDVQEKVCKKIQNTIGMEETVDVSIHVGKIFHESAKGRGKKENQGQDEEAPSVPFHGYRA